MGEVLSHLKEAKKKKNWKPYHDELFSTLSIDDGSIIAPYIDLLKTSDTEKALKDLGLSGNSFKLTEKVVKSFMVFVDYLLENNRYEELFQQAYSRYNNENKEIFGKVYNTTLGKLGEILSNVKSGKEELSKFYVLQVIKLLRGDAFVFKLGQGRIWFEKDYLYGDEARKINEDKSNRPVYGLRMHVGDNASIYSLNTVFKEMGEFVHTANIGVKPYVGMTSWLLDTELLKYRLERKGWSKEKIDEFMDKYYGRLGKITLASIKDSGEYRRAKKRASNHTSDKELMESYEKEGHKIKLGSCLINLDDMK